MPIVQFAPFSSLVQPAFWHALTELKVDVLRLSDDAINLSANYSLGRSVKDRETGTEIALGCNLSIGGEAFTESQQLPPHSVPVTGVFKNFNTIEEFKAVDKTALFSKCRTRYLLVLSLYLFSDHLKKYKYYYWFAFPAFVAKPAWEIDGNWESAEKQFNEDTQTVAFLDPSALPSNPGWPLRNLLAYLRALHLSRDTASVRILCWRDAEFPVHGSGWKSRRRLWVGEERAGKLGPRVADLAPMMDPTRLANQAVDLNLKLMRWRILPSLDLEKVANTRCLLLGAGTLGCYVARTLMGWGVRTITFVDSARVSFSNPVRQPLFEFEDCLNGGKPKAACAAERLKKIFPGINSNGYNLSIPMPGHPIPPSSIEQAKKDVEALEKLFDEHDAVFLLMDSRESRWLPTVLGAAKGKASSYDNSLTDRTLDQMCTVTRPGLASIAASTAVELLVSLLQHPDGVHAPAPPPQAGNDAGNSQASEGVLGLVPHQLRGFLAQFRNMPIVGAAYNRCTGCSETILKAYETQGFDMLLKAFNDTGYLETLTGLDKLYEEGEAVFESVDFDEEDDDF
ncbi:Ubiquitin-like modifier-activating enzyme ATG7 [Grifola frondosa]|uniref:Ubiquitin-like modifier-activating enzyme ATG7 n=1 Tax=Grifola frondosa TaxID=5627 RepID=A0A1C7LQJ1_GRIFR|nr:Ubiquitin-like modifier-activating enzyme ATG7 [Grifola frondosa]